MIIESSEHLWPIMPIQLSALIASVLLALVLPLQAQAANTPCSGSKGGISHCQGNWFMHFTASRRSNWPGVAQKGHASNDLALGPDVELTENTFAAFDPAKGVMVLQYTRSAVRASRLFGFLDLHTEQPNSFLYFPVLNQDAMQRYQNKHAYTVIEAVVHDITPADVAYFKGSSIATAVRESVTSGITKMAFSFNVDARIIDDKINAGFVSKLVDLLLKRAANQQGAAGGLKDKLVVGGRDTADSPVEKIDLLEDAKVAEYDERSITLTPGRRYRARDMKRTLFDALGR